MGTPPNTPKKGDWCTPRNPKDDRKGLIIRVDPAEDDRGWMMVQWDGTEITSQCHRNELVKCDPPELPKHCVFCGADFLEWPLVNYPCLDTGRTAIAATCSRCVKKPMNERVRLLNIHIKPLYAVSQEFQRIFRSYGNQTEGIEHQAFIIAQSMAVREMVRVACDFKLHGAPSAAAIVARSVKNICDNSVYGGEELTDFVNVFMKRVCPHE